jgi:hypothetical protein
MTKLTWLALGVLVLSLIANALLGISTYVYGTQLRTTQTALNDRITKYNDATAALKSAKSLLANAEAKVTTLEGRLAESERIADDYRDRASAAEYFVTRAKCSTMVNELVAYGATSNAGVKAAVVDALENLYSGSISTASFDTLWNDSQSSILTSFWGSGTTKTILSWTPSGDLRTVYDVGAGCVMYTR